MIDHTKIWEDILHTIEDNKILEEKSISTWFNNTEAVRIINNQLTVKVPTKFIADYLNKNYILVLEDVASVLFKKEIKIIFISSALSNITLNEDQTRPNMNNLYHNIRLNKFYTFNEFVVGKSNNFAHSTAYAVAEAPGSSYNPLFLYGESGMGKTHLMQAIGNYIKDYDPYKKIHYTTTEQFTNEMIDALRSNSIQKFRSNIRNIDVLLIDDIHFLSKKEGTQEEFFHTFNTLYDNQKQIVITSDRPPKDIPDLEKRLVTRFEWGLLADLKSPDFETRVAILRKKMEHEEIYLQNDVINFISEHIHNNIRALEGSLTRILAFASYSNLEPEEINVTMAGEILDDMITNKVQEITLDKIKQKVCEAFQLSTSQIIMQTRKKDISFPRQVAMYLSNLLIPQIPLKDIAKYYNRKDHTTVLHAKRKIEKEFKEDKNLRIQIETLIKEIKN